MSGGIHFVPSLVVTGALTGKRLVHLKSAEMISLTTGQKLPMKIYAKDGAIDVSEAELIPPGANIRLETMLNAGQQPGGRPVMEKNDFLEKWGSYAFVVEFDDKKYEEVFSSEVVAARFTKPRRPVRPQVTRRSHA